MAKIKEVESIICNAIDAYHKKHPELRVGMIRTALLRIDEVLFTAMTSKHASNPKYSKRIH